MRLYSASRILPLVCLLLLSGACSTAPRPADGADAAASLAVDGATASATALPDGSCGLASTPATTDEEAIRSVLAAEGEFVVAQDIGALMRLWSDDSTVTDAKHSPDNAADDQVWSGVDAIRHRYVRVVFPGAPAAVQPADLDIQIQGARAVVTATTQIGNEVSPHGDRWQLNKQEGCWLLQSLTFNLETGE